MKAILIGGPLHGKSIAIDSEKAIKAFNREREGDVYVYTRRADLPSPGPGQVLFTLEDDTGATAPATLPAAPELCCTSEAQFSYLKIDDEL